MAWRADYSFPVQESGLKRTIKEYLRQNFYGGILAGEFFIQEPGAVHPSWTLSFNAYLGMVDVIGIDRRRLPLRQHGSRSAIPGSSADQSGR